MFCLLLFVFRRKQEVQRLQERWEKGLFDSFVFLCDFVPYQQLSHTRVNKETCMHMPCRYSLVLFPRFKQ